MIVNISANVDKTSHVNKWPVESAQKGPSVSEGRRGENVLMVTLGYGILVTVVDLRVLVTLFYSMELW